VAFFAALRFVPVLLVSVARVLFDRVFLARVGIYLPPPPSDARSKSKCFIRARCFRTPNSALIHPGNGWQFATVLLTYRPLPAAVGACLAQHAAAKEHFSRTAMLRSWRSPMKVTSEHLKTLHALYIDHLKKALDMERHITKALPTMVDKSTTPELANAFRSHLQETEQHVSRLEQILQRHTGSAKTETCKTIGALITEAENGIKDAKDPMVLDVTLIAAGQEVEHHEIAVYGTLRSWAQLMGHNEDVSLLEATLKEEKAADEKLTSISVEANARAAA
jgi:ferritin-like metal-binding protein YciE